jgi:hypothetical protein
MTVDKLLDKVQARTATEDEIELAVNILHYCGSMDYRATPLVGTYYCGKTGKVIDVQNEDWRPYSNDLCCVVQNHAGTITTIKYHVRQIIEDFNKKMNYTD